MSTNESYEAWLARVQVANRALCRGDELPAVEFVRGELALERPLPIVVATIKVTRFGWEPLAKHLAAIQLLRTCPLADVPVFAIPLFGPDEPAMIYWNEPGGARLIAIPAMLIARMVAAERLLASDRAKDLVLAKRWFGDAKRTSKRMFFSFQVAGLPELGARLAARMAELAAAKAAKPAKPAKAARPSKAAKAGKTPTRRSR